MRLFIPQIFIICLLKSFAQSNDLKISLDKNFNDLYHSNENIALKAFVKLTEYEPEVIANKIETIPENNYVGRHFNYSLPTFPTRFLYQLVQFTHYCKKNNIPYNKDKKIQTQLLKLRNYRKNSNFHEKYKIENELLTNLNLENISELEYWSLIYSKIYPSLNHSVGRVLDIFYSNKFDSILRNEAYLKLYLKKSALFEEIHIVGTINNYLYKFIGIEKNQLSKYLNIYSADGDIISQIEKVKRITDSNIELSKIKSERYDTAYFSIPNIESVFDFFRKHQEYITDELTDSLYEVISQAEYKQIPIILNFLESTNFGKEIKLYQFLERDFGFFLIDETYKKSTRKKFLKLYNSFTEEMLYKHLLDVSGIDYKTKSGELDFSKIHTILKYDAVEPFIGGYVNNDYGTYALIKLLQLHFKTRLGFSNKQCRTRKYYWCDCIQESISWIEYLENNNFVDKTKKYPISFHYKHFVVQ